MVRILILRKPSCNFPVDPLAFVRQEWVRDLNLQFSKRKDYQLYWPSHPSVCLFESSSILPPRPLHTLLVLAWLQVQKAAWNAGEFLRWARP